MVEIDEAYFEICAGKTPGVFNGRTIIFEHGSIFDQFKAEKEKKKQEGWAAKQGLPSREEAIKIAIKDGFWTEEREIGLKLKQDDYRMLWSKRGKGKVVSVEAIRNYHQDLREMKSEIDSDLIERSMVTQLCQETHAGGAAFDMEMFISAKRENGLPFFEYSDFEYLSETELAALRSEYSNNILKFDEDLFKRLSVTPFFYSVFDNYVASPGDFFKKPAPELTVFQISLLRNAKRFNEVLKIAWDAPPDFYEYPDCLETLAMVRQNGSGSEGSSIDPSTVESDLAEMKRG